MHSNPVNKIMNPQEAGRVVWITGLSGAGKSVLATSLVARLRSIDGALNSFQWPCVGNQPPG
tara:strand:+ start:1701 stop:1886 length:186 start_codon:yes stop_codon:yes gene_type:complete